MAHFYGTLLGSSNKSVTRTGGQASGVRAVVAGWNFGAQVEVGYNAQRDADAVSIHLDGGSNGAVPTLYLGTFSELDTTAEIATRLRAAADRIEQEA